MTDKPLTLLLAFWQGRPAGSKAAAPPFFENSQVSFRTRSCPCSVEMSRPAAGPLNGSGNAPKH